ncbi:MAG: undecaprenyl-diphosphatase [Flavobacteriales bacterium]|jgi:undecaprenyl-diphosphatase
MWQQLEQWDREFFIYLNGLGSETYDAFWIFVTKIEHWIPWYLFILVLFFIVYKHRQAIIGILLSLVVVGFSLGITEIVKNVVSRLRPNNTPDIAELIRVLQSPNSFSFFSGHASVSVAVTTFVVLALRHQLKWIYVIYIWPLLFISSRVYVGVHYPGDIIVGSLVGVIIGVLFWRFAGRRWIQIA